MTIDDDRSWIKPGNRAAVFVEGFVTSARIVTIERVTATQVVILNDQRFRLDTLRPVGRNRNSWSITQTQLLPLTDPRVINALAADHIRSLRQTLKAALRDPTDPADALAILADLEAAIASTRNNINALTSPEEEP